MIASHRKIRMNFFSFYPWHSLVIVERDPIDKIPWGSLTIEGNKVNYIRSNP